MFELGNNLREARRGRHIDLVMAEQDTKIRSKYLAALETEDFDVLPGPVFVRGFLRTYSRYLGLDPQLFVDEYNARFGRFEEAEEQASPALGRTSLAQARANRGRRTMRLLIIVVLIATSIVLWLGLRENTDATATAPTKRAEPLDPAANAGDERGALNEAAQSAANNE
jgi:cytoskeletal protein RodZ